MVGVAECTAILEVFMDPDQLDPATAASAAATTDQKLAKLESELAALEAQAPKTAAAPSGGEFGDLFLCLVISVIGFALVNYARKTGDIVLGVFGVAMMVVPYFVSTTPWLLVAGAVLIGTPLLLKKFQVI